ncbi:MAG: carboxypeptidase regulatory-like domain-containing protein [Pseudomonadota bacterium]
MAEPTDFEQLMVELINRARLDPQGEVGRLIDLETGEGRQANVEQAMNFFGVDVDVLVAQLAQVDPVAPLAWSEALGTSADTHSELMIQFDQQGHNLPGEPGLSARAINAGYSGLRALAENVFAFSEDAVQAHAAFYIDWGPSNDGSGIQPGAGHRVAILSDTYTEIGVGAIDVPESNSIGPISITQHFGDRFDAPTYLTGVVIDDGDGDDFYDIGEGLGGVTVTAQGTAGSFSTVTYSSGGYSLALPDGSYTVTVSGTGLDGVVTGSVTISGENVKFDADANDAVPASGGTPDPTPDPDPVPNDPVPPSASDDTTMGTAGNDILTGGDGAEAINGGGGNDRVYGNGGNDRVLGASGNDILDGGTGRDVLIGGDGDDRIKGGNDADVLHGQNGRDILDGDGGVDRLFGGDGGDLLRGGTGGDVLNGGNDNDTMVGGLGDDVMIGGAGDDRSIGNDGDDRMRGLDGADLLIGGNGEDRLYGQGGDDIIRGQGGDDVLVGGAGVDVMLGGANNDVIQGGAGNDRAFGDSGNDILRGQNGNDVLYGGAGNDRLHGEGGNDRIDGGFGNDVMTGGGGRDRFVFEDAFGSDRITDFNAAAGELLDFTGHSGVSSLEDIVVIDRDAGALVSVAGEGDAVLLIGLTAAEVTDDNLLI